LFHLHSSAQCAHTERGLHTSGATEKRARGSCRPAPNEEWTHQITDAAGNYSSLTLPFDLPQSRR